MPLLQASGCDALFLEAEERFRYYRHRQEAGSISALTSELYAQFNYFVTGQLPALQRNFGPSAKVAS